MAKNSPTGDYLALCLTCRDLLDSRLAEFLGASVGAARIVADLYKLTGGQLISKHELRRVLEEDGDIPVGQHGPISRELTQKALRLLRHGRTVS